MSRIHPHEIPVENRIEQASPGHIKSGRDKKCDLDVSEDDNHEPTEGYRRVHVTKQGFSLPYLDMEKAVSEKVLKILNDRFGDNQ